MAATLRVVGRNSFSESATIKPMTFGMPFLSKFARYEKQGWNFFVVGCPPRDCNPPDRHRLAEIGLRLPSYCEDSYFFINHLESGIKFTFNARDALRKWLEEKSIAPLGSDLPSYDSPLRPAVDHQYDSAYVGRVLLKKASEHPRYIDPVWEYIDWKTLREEIVWTTNREKLSSSPSLYTYYRGDGPTTFKNPELETKGKKPKRKGLLNPLVNFKKRLYFDSYQSCEEGSSSCDLYLVVTDCGWSLSLYQIFSNCFGDRRIREMTMHCKFKHNIIYREILERQSKDFEKRLSRLCMGMEEKQDDEMRVHFHEVKQLNIPEAFMGGSSSCTVGDAKKYISFSNGEWERAHLGALDVFDDKIESLFAYCGKQIKSFEEITGIRIQIIPLFRHPYNPKDPEDVVRKVPRAVYLHGLNLG